jgi:hypothetical protein
MEDGGDNDNERKREGRCTEGMMEKRVVEGVGREGTRTIGRAGGKRVLGRIGPSV